MKTIIAHTKSTEIFDLVFFTQEEKFKFEFK